MTRIDRRASATLAFLLNALEHGVTAIPFVSAPGPRARPERESDGTRMPGDAGAGPGTPELKREDKPWNR